MAQLDQLEVFYGEVTPSFARVYARLSGIGPESGLSLRGEIRGPMCKYAKTLPAFFPLKDLGPGESLLAEGLIPDPCFWTSELPALYSVEVELLSNGEAVESEMRHLGIRRSGTEGKKLVLEGKRWVIRGVNYEALPATDLTNWRETVTAMVVDFPSEELCREASEIGVWLVPRLSGSVERVTQAMKKISRFAAVVMVIVEGNLPLKKRDTPNIILAQNTKDADSTRPASWAEVLFCESGQAGKFAECNMPIVVVQDSQKWDSIENARRGCEILQRDMISLGDFAGYIV